MKRIISTVLVRALACTMVTACGKKEDSSSGSGSNANTYEIALSTDKGNIDDKSFNQGSWEGVEAFAKKNNIAHQYYKPEIASDEGYLAMIETAIQGGAKVVVTPGFLFEVAVYIAQDKYPDVKFILLDGSPRTADYSEIGRAHV